MPLGDFGVKGCFGVKSGKDNFFFPITNHRKLLMGVEDVPKEFQAEYGVARKHESGKIRIVRCGEKRGRAFTSRSRTSWSLKFIA
ncbi:MAG: hypothetical protein R3C45_14510 [Phycisphaerales bacterium]